MDLQDFIKQNIPNSETREDVKQYISYKECLANPALYDRIEVADHFEQFLDLKDKLFDEAMGNYITKREREMAKIDEFSKVVFCDVIPEVLEYGILYVSEKFETANHLCPCGCGNEVPIPISVTEHCDLNWEYRRNGDKITFSPSLLNKHCPNKAHYFVRDNKIVWC